MAWRDAISRLHEVMAQIVPHLGGETLDRLHRALKPVFVDDYATVPHLSIERLLALHRAGRQEVKALGDDYRLDNGGRGPSAAVSAEGQR